MKIEHIGIWVNNLEIIKSFYTKYFNLKCSSLYKNESKGFSSYFLSFESGARIEIMNIQGLSPNSRTDETINGFAHFAISCGGKQKVNEITEIIRADGYEIFSEPRTTGDGYYESVVLDPEDNKIEITE